MVQPDIEKHEAEKRTSIERERLEMQKDAERRHAISSKKQTINHGVRESPELVTFDSVESFCHAYVQQLMTEINFLRDNGEKRQRIFDGKFIENKHGKYIYLFETDSELNYPDETQVTLWKSKPGVPGSVICCEDFTITIATSENLGEKVSSIELSAQPWKLLDSLIDHLRAIQESAVSPIVQALICEGKLNILMDKPLKTGQENALKMSLTQPITFVWGPPGTGKTETLAKIALEHIQKGNRVLMLSYSNVSVDGAILRVQKQAVNAAPGRLLRYGYPRDKALLDHEYLTSHNLTIRNHPTLLHERAELFTERRKLSSTQRATPRYVKIQTRLTEIRNLLLEEEKSNVRSAAFVATTVSKAIADKTIYEDDFDVVIFDEASMAYIPQIVFSAGLAKTNFVCMGDFAQLPPIVQNNSKSMLHSDIFRYCGIARAVEHRHGHRWLCLLDTQYRMHPQISDFASNAMYHALLKSADSMQQERQPIAHCAPLPDHALGLADLSGMMSVCTQTSDMSRINPLSALVALGLALKSAEHHAVGIITPYHAQSRLLHAMARDTAEQNPALHAITCATVHQFQGSETDVIIYDTVDCYLQRYPGMLLTSTANNFANRLFNVALTRAKGKFIAIANIDYLENKKFSPSLMFAKLIRKYQTTEQCVDGSHFSREMPDGKGARYSWMDKNRGSEFFVKDILEAKSEVRIDIPGKIACDEKTEKDISAALDAAKSRGVKVFVRVQKGNTLSGPLQQHAKQNNYVVNPVSLIDRKIVWFGQPLSADTFISEGRIIETRYRPIIRFVGEQTAKALYGFLEMNKTIDRSEIPTKNDDPGETFRQYVASHCHCRTCGKAMRLQKGKTFFLGCSGYPECKNTQPIQQDFVEDFLYEKSVDGKHCPQCRNSLETRKGQYGVYVQCCGIVRHKYSLDQI